MATSGLLRGGVCLLLLTGTSLVAGEEVSLVGRDAKDVTVQLGTLEALEDGLHLFRRTRAAQFIDAYSNERYTKVPFVEQLSLYVAEGRYEDLFLAGDDAFAFEADGVFGAQTKPAPVHDGARGGADGASCRACHFAGGPDGAGSSTQRALTSGDGVHFASALVRDAPHVKGLGYVSRLAREMEEELFATRLAAEEAALLTDAPVRFPLVAKGVSFGELWALPGGEVDASGVEGVSPDLQIRPFGRKGRHADLVKFADEALQIHHGLQTASRVSEFEGNAELLGAGPPDDPDGDGAVVLGMYSAEYPGTELPHAHSLLLAAYLALIGVPEIHPPRRPDLLEVWTRGRALMNEVQCTSCHVERLWLHDDVLELRGRGAFDTTLQLPLLEAGIEPRPRRTIFGNDDELLGVAPLFLYSDLKRHDLGPEAAEADDEILPDGSIVPASVFLTRSLWGLADTAPYMADGSALTVHDAILRHGGDAAPSRAAYLALAENDRAALRVFLLSLTRTTEVLVE
ncbi:MAG: di-heme oxidoredictase family protein [Myxococcota bacterium]